MNISEFLVNTNIYEEFIKKPFCSYQEQIVKARFVLVIMKKKSFRRV